MLDADMTDRDVTGKVRGRSHRAARGRLTMVTALCGLLLAGGRAAAEAPFVYNDEPIHPGCVQALVMQDGDAVPVTTSISLRGCKASSRSKATITWSGSDLATIEDEALLGGGSFGYRLLSTLKNGIYIVGIIREHPDGTRRHSLAALDVKARPMLVSGQVLDQTMLETVCEIWVKDIEFSSLRTIGNTIHFSAGVGPSRSQRSVDLTRIKKARK